MGQEKPEKILKNILKQLNIKDIKIILRKIWLSKSTSSINKTK